MGQLNRVGRVERTQTFNIMMKSPAKSRLKGANMNNAQSQRKKRSNSCPPDFLLDRDINKRRENKVSVNTNSGQKPKPIHSKRSHGSHMMKRKYLRFVHDLNRDLKCLKCGVVLPENQHCNEDTELEEEEKIKKFCEITGLTKKWSNKFLISSKFDIHSAKKSFSSAKSLGRIPPSAFKN